MRNGFKLFFSLVISSIVFSAVDYQTEIQPIFNANCMGCHAGGYSGGLQLGSYSELMTGGNSGNTVVAGDHIASNLWVRTDNGSMPPNGTLSTEDINLIAEWIDEGATETIQNPTGSNVFITELTDPENSSDAGRYVELHNSGDSDIDLSTWQLQRWTNGNTDPSSPANLTGTILAGGFFIICNDADKFNTTYGLTCDQDIGTGGAADSNGDDNIALIDGDGVIVDMFGVAGEDGSGTGHEFEDGRAERAAIVTQGNPVWDETEWNVDNDSGGGDGNQYAPEGFDPFAWIGGGEVTTPDPDVFIVGDMNGWTPGSADWGMISVNGIGVLTSSLSTGTYGYKVVEGSTWDDSNYPGTNQSVSLSEDGDVTFYVNVNNDLVFHTNPSVVGGFFSGMDGSGDWDPANVSGEMIPTENDLEWNWTGVLPIGTWEFKVALNQNFDQSTGDNISINSDGISSTNIYYNFDLNETSYETEAPTHSVTFNVNMNFQEVDVENGIRIFGLGSWEADNATIMTDEDGDGIYSATANLIAGSYEYKFRNGWTYEVVDEADCAVLTGEYWNRSLTVTDSDAILDVNCFGACADCIGGCTDSYATNYNPDANTDDGSCEFPVVEPDNLFFSEYGEGSSYNKYLEIYNGSDIAVALVGYQRTNCSNGCTEWEYYSDFAEGASIESGDVYVLCDSGVADDFPSIECDEVGALYFNGDDVQGLYHISSGSTIDAIGAIGEDPGSGWAVAGVSNGTKDHSLIRKSSVLIGNSDWVLSAGETAEDSEWVVQDQNTWVYIGSHPHDFASICDDASACNNGEEGDCIFAEEGFDCDGNVQITVAFNVNMSEQVVDTEGYGLDLFLDGSYHDMFDEDGDGIWSTSLVLTSNTDYSYKFKNGSDWEVDFNELGCGDGSDYGNRFFTTSIDNSDVGPFCFNSCADCVAEVVCGTGDSNGDDSVDVTDIVLVVQGILGETTLDENQICRADVTGDGVVNVTDIVNIVYIILGSGMDNNSFANSITISKTDHELNLSASGIVGAIQLTISHNQNAEIVLTGNSFMSKLNTEDNHTTIILISPEIGQIVKIDTDFEILEMIASDLEGEIDVSIIDEFSLLSNYPNPFNPVTTISYFNEKQGNVKINIYDLNGRLINTLISESKQAGQYQINWHGTDDSGFNVTSGVYLLTLENESGITTSKITLLR